MDIAEPDRAFLTETFQVANYADVGATADLQRRRDHVLAVAAYYIDATLIVALRAAFDDGDILGVYLALERLLEAEKATP